MSNGRFEIWDELLNKPVIEFFNIMSYMKDKNEMIRIETERLKTKRGRV
jgi:hypothetical protein